MDKCSPTPAPTCCPADAPESGRSPEPRRHISPAASRAHKRAEKDTAASPAPTIGPSRPGTRPAACRILTATSRPCRRIPTRARLCSPALHTSGTTAAWAAQSHAIRATHPATPWDRCWSCRILSQLIQVQAFPGTRAILAFPIHPLHPGCNLSQLLRFFWIGRRSQRQRKPQQLDLPRHRLRHLQPS